MTTSSKLRITVAVVTALETAVVLFIVWIVVSGGGLSSSEELSRRISKALLVVYGVPYLVLVLPAVIMAAVNRWLPLALVLCTLGVALALISAKSWA